MKDVLHITYHSHSDHNTMNLGKILGEVLKEGDVVALVGKLGSGKTWFTKGLALGIQVSRDTIVTSPSFSLLNAYEGRCTLFHIDAYRLERLSDFLSAGLDEYFFKDGIVAMEWADRWPEILPERTVKVELSIVDDSSRKITLSGRHPRAVEVLERVEENL
ncbi:MAG: tRNA (adenosine(37)-N6)-threonylcarbamoyltransferase complex ATPase subunit type 1 TsaE [Deltaproteobacteria bacterium]|nr:tRNA (adenosine(37)-N6)-threonylcarbamoyltransferase complex ATPase subunit type 1 TsaE [Deltaproteobacteria bacterium]